MIKLGSKLEKLTQRHRPHEPAERFNMSQNPCHNNICASTQFLQLQKNRVIDLQEDLELYCIIVTVFVLNSAKNDLNVIKSCLLPIFVNEGDIAPTLIKRTNQIIEFKIRHFQLLDKKNSLGGATSQNTHLKAYKLSETKSFCQTNGVIT